MRATLLCLAALSVHACRQHGGAAAVDLPSGGEADDDVV